MAHTSQKTENQAITSHIVTAFFMLAGTPCTQFAHNFWKTVIINDKQCTPEGGNLFHFASYFCIGYPGESTNWTLKHQKRITTKVVILLS